ncbi:imelysin family protein [Pedobacter sp. JY14-1]|uniref:imelysin family protein n=1 Tax=Pedobacter sp. JY14-1 TaxID=3034151 RepID=UPI0023E18C59|nr:imelysin family protein [Pedobacter sp. JY14-1]
MKINQIKPGIVILITAFTIFIVACSKKTSKDNSPQAEGFDKGTMLADYADHLIIPAYTGLQQQITQFEAAVSTFLTTPDAGNQQALKTVFKAAYIQYEQISVNQFGPSERVLLNNFLNTFPADKAVIDGNILRGTYDLTQNFTVDQQGFPALDYVLFAPDALSKFNDNGAANRRKYVLDLIARMKTLTGNVITAWNTGYRTEFVSNTRSDAGSPIAFLINQFAYEMDQMKGPRIGWPYGKQSSGIQYPDKVEGYYSGISVALAVANLGNLKKMFTGNNSGKGISGYLAALGKKALSDDVISQFDVTIGKLNAIPDPLSSALVSNKAEIDAAYREVQVLLTLLKTDVASSTGVRITYQDTDGD